MKWMLTTAAVLLAGCASNPPAAEPRAEVRVVRGATPAVVDFADGLGLKLTPEGHPPFSQMRLVERAGYRTPLHVHHDTDETFFVASGQLTLFVNGETHTLGPGDYAFIPRGTPHAQGNQTSAESVIVLTLAPGAFEGFFDARSELVLTTPPDHPGYRAAMMALGERFDIEVLGPAPF
jgi:quercetin dioxygenase-like cupin family protein